MHHPYFYHLRFLVGGCAQGKRRTLWSKSAQQVSSNRLVHLNRTAPPNEPKYISQCRDQTIYIPGIIITMALRCGQFCSCALSKHSFPLKLTESIQSHARRETCQHDRLLHLGGNRSLLAKWSNHPSGRPRHGLVILSFDRLHTLVGPRRLGRDDGAVSRSRCLLSASLSLPGLVHRIRNRLDVLVSVRTKEQSVRTV